MRAVVSDTEVGVRKRCKLGYGRTDGLIVALTSGETPLVASLEAKSSLTQDNVTPWTRDGSWLLHGVFVGAVAHLEGGDSGGHGTQTRGGDTRRRVFLVH